MARISGITLIQQPPQTLVTIRREIDFMAEYGDFAGQCFARITSYLDGQGRLPADGPVVCFHNQELERLDVEIGFPVAEALPGQGDILCHTLPPQKAVSAIDQGRYEDQDPTLLELMGWIAQSPHEAAGPIYYQYLNDTDRPEAELLTKMILPLK